MNDDPQLCYGQSYETRVELTAISALDQDIVNIGTGGTTDIGIHRNAAST
jgi:hypothetical protein